MTIEELKKLIERALKSSADVEIDRSGRSPFDVAREIVREFVKDRRADELLDALIEIGRQNQKRNVEWWLSFLDLFEEMRVLMPRLGIRLLDFFLKNPPADPEARAYFLRFLSYLDAPIPWNDLPNGSSPNELIRNAPLVVAEAFVWAKKFSEAKRVLSTALGGGKFNASDLREMAQRWSDVLGSSGDQFILGVRALANNFKRADKYVEPGATTIADFGQRVHDRSQKFYDPVPRAIAHAQ